jgi:hypothetical protein
VPLVAAAICPNPPLLVPDLAAGAAGELDDLRAACDAAVAQLWSARPELVAVVGVGPQTRELPSPYRGSFAPWGVALEVRLGGGPAGTEGTPVAAGPSGSPAVPAPGADLPLGPLVGAWLLARQPEMPPVRIWTVDAAADPEECVQTGRKIAEEGRVALLVMGDGAACHGPKAPGYADPRAAPFDAAVLEALVDVDTARLLALDPELADQLLASGRAPWQVLAGAAAGAGRRRRSMIRYADAPYGVGYFVASWS